MIEGDELRLARKIEEFHDSLSAQGIGPRLVFGTYVAILALCLRNVSQKLRQELAGDLIEAFDEVVPHWRPKVLD
jgi:hypothetical protein